MRRRALLMGGKSEPNTIIGGVGSVITTKSALATKLGISESIIKGFEVVGSDVHARIGSNYNIPIYSFLSDSTITKYIDLEGKVQVVGQQAFSNSTIINAYFPAAFLQSLAFGASGSPMQLTNVDYGFEYVYPHTTIEGQVFRNAKIVRLTAPNLTVLSENLMMANSNLQIVDAPNVTAINQLALSSCSALNSIDLSNVTSIGNRCFINCSSMPYFHLTSLTTLVTGTHNGGYFYNCSGATEVLMPELVNIANNTRQELFRGMTSCNLISMKKLKTLGDATTASTSTFQTLKLACTIQVHEFMATSNSGNADATLQWAKDNRSAIVEFYDDSGNYVSTL